MSSAVAALVVSLSWESSAQTIELVVGMAPAYPSPDVTSCQERKTPANQQFGQRFSLVLNSNCRISVSLLLTYCFLPVDHV